MPKYHCPGGLKRPAPMPPALLAGRRDQVLVAGCSGAASWLTGTALSLCPQALQCEPWGLGAPRSLLPPRPLSPSRGPTQDPVLTRISPGRPCLPALGSARSSEKRWAVLVVCSPWGRGLCASHRVGALITCCAGSTPRRCQRRDDSPSQSMAGGAAEDAPRP